MALALFEALCPNCGGRIDTDRLEKGLACERCLPHPAEGHLCELLEQKLQYTQVCELLDREKKFIKFFTEKMNNPPWSLQKLWAKRIFQGQSFAIVAPTGVGKTTFGATMACFLEGKSYIIVPTRTLLDQVKRQCKSFSEKRIVAYSGKKGEKDSIKRGDFDILITTNAFLSHNFELLQDKVFDFIFIDDTDSFLKSGKNIDKVFLLLGFTHQQLESIMKGQIQEPFKPKGVLVVSSATLKPKTNRAILFRKALGFEVSPVRVSLRNVLDCFQIVKDEEEALQQLPNWIERFGKGGLVYVSLEFGRRGVKSIVDGLRECGLKVVSYEDFNAEEFRKGGFDVAVGISVSNNSLVRGIDLPDVIRYAIFLDVPHISFPLKLDSPSVQRSLLLALREFVEDERVDKYLTILHSQRKPSTAFSQEISSFLRKYLADPSIFERLKSSETLLLEDREGESFIRLADPATYLQASGRTSRMFAGGVSRGISLVVCWNERLLNNLKKRLRLFFEDLDFVDAKEVDWQRELKRVDEDRLTVKKLSAEGSHSQPNVRSTLIVVESPNKARTIARFFGTPQVRLVENLVVWETTTGDRLIAITASLGHVFDLVEDEGLYGVLELDDLYLPVYSSIKVCEECGEQTTNRVCSKKHAQISDKLDFVRALRKLSIQFDEVLIATDPDAEGEKIAYDLTLALKPFNANVKRSEFHEVTKIAFKKAIDSPRMLNDNLVKAQIARRVLDRWVGFSLSSELWRVFRRYDLSAGRVQTPVLGWIIERTENFKQKKALLRLLAKDEKGNSLWLDLQIDDPSSARKMADRILKRKLKVKERFEEILQPPSPHNTATVLSELGTKFNTSDLMETLQQLFEQGLITYHRTDSFTVSETGVKLAEQIILEKFSRDLFHPRRYPSTGAHECIRIVKNLTPKELKLWIELGKVDFSRPNLAMTLYSTIYERFIASQMKPVKVLKKKLQLELDSNHYEWVIIDSVIEHGFDLVLPIKTQRVGDEPFIAFFKIDLMPKVFPFTQGSLIEQMRQRGLGRPSTYAKIVQNLLERGYVVQKGGYLFATELGRKVFEWLSEHYLYFVSESLTRELEEKSDEIERGSLNHLDLLKSLRKNLPFTS
ncbi:reverse gyrase [Pseudothermotoga sp.]|nr:reverse gyrase [Pseudothermotoga sp.]MDW8139691.1 reverse gyrase [Pseudothermotoga sp.]